MKTCSKCQKELPFECFQKNKARPDGWNYWCRECTKVLGKRASEHRRANNLCLSCGGPRDIPDRKNCAKCKGRLKKWTAKRPELVKSRNDSWHQATRIKVFNHYGWACACCGESRRQFLTIDHVNGGGRAHQRQPGATHLYGWLVKNKFPEGFQTLCYNCNCSKGRCGVCPHETERSTMTSEALPARALDHAPMYVN